MSSSTHNAAGAPYFLNFKANCVIWGGIKYASFNTSISEKTSLIFPSRSMHPSFITIALCAYLATAYLMMKLGLATEVVTFGPGDFRLSYRPNEWINVNDLVMTSKVYRRLMEGKEHV